MSLSTAARLGAVTLLLLGASACGMSEDRFLGNYVEAQCDFLFECYEAEAEASFDSPKDCADEYDDYLDDYSDYYADCEYSSSEAKACLKAVRDLPCDPDGDDFDALDDACSEVWAC